MFELLKAMPADPLLGIIESYRNDSNPKKIDLGVGVYKDELGCTPVLKAVKRAESDLLSSQQTKTYLGAQGDRQFTQAINRLAFGPLYESIDDRLAALQTPGGCGALRVAAELLVRARPKANIWVSDPTWANHVPLLGSAGLQINTYPYYDDAKKCIRFEAMMDCLQSVTAGDLVLLHACCHNPCGADLSRAQWDAVVELCEQKDLIPFVDMAYQGFGEGLDQDAYGPRLIAEKLPEAIFTVSCSKNFGLYRDRVGVVAFLTEFEGQCGALMSNLVQIVRGMYSMPPDHGAAVVAAILSNDELSAIWKEELKFMRLRIQKMRDLVASTMAEKGFGEQFNFVTRERGMFSFLGITEAQVAAMASKYGIYMASSSRVNIAGLSENSIGYFCEALADVMQP